MGRPRLRRRRRLRRGRGSYWLCVSTAHLVGFHGVPFQAVLCRSKPSPVVREIVIVGADSGWL